jgi:hypothetical protein
MLGAPWCWGGPEAPAPTHTIAAGDATRCNDEWFAHPAAPFKSQGDLSETIHYTPHGALGLMRIDHGWGTVLLDMASLQSVAFLPNEGFTYSPRQSALDSTGRFLAVGGGKQGEIILWKREE